MSSAIISQTSKIKPILGGHETFAFRNGWLKKGVDAAAENGKIFTEENALVTLGVGKNMVRSIRHWCLATGLLEEASSSGLSRPLQSTWLADRLFLNGGWDPFLEKEGSLWLMHWQLATNRVRGIVWAISFSEYLETEFSKQSISNFITKQLDHYNVRTTHDMILRELDCCLHTYITTRTSNKQKSKSDGISEENLDCPLAELDLIRYMPEYDLYHFNVGPKLSLPVEIFGYALLKFISSVAQKRSTVALEECVYQPDSPGQVFKLDENSVVEYLEELEHRYLNGLRLIETAGLSQVYLAETIDSDLETSAHEILQSYYE
jgi:hypothetical protein